jgi:hypothetical protein
LWAPSCFGYRETERLSRDEIRRSFLHFSDLDESYECSINSSMGRLAGVSVGETREQLLRAAADVFAERGYDAPGWLISPPLRA